MNFKKYVLLGLATVAVSAAFQGCKPKGAGQAISGDAAEKVYVAPG